MFLGLALAGSLLICSCGGNSESTSGLESNSQSPVDFVDPREVSILGYTGDAMEPSLSRDGVILFFNNLNSESLVNGANNDTNIHYATRIDDVTFQYVGEVAGANIDEISDANELEGVPSLDKNGKFYFIRTIDYLNPESSDYLLSIFQADYVDGRLVNIQSLPSLKHNRVNQEPVLGELNFDAEIHPDGEDLYFVEGIFSGGAVPDEADIGVASESDGIFKVDENSVEEMALVNTVALEYAPSISSNSLELYFTRASGSIESGYEFGIYVATRNSVADSWSNISRIEAISGEITEGPSISLDGTLLYYHQRKSGVFRIYVVTRN